MEFGGLEQNMLSSLRILSIILSDTWSEPTSATTKNKHSSGRSLMGAFAPKDYICSTLVIAANYTAAGWSNLLHQFQNLLNNYYSIRPQNM